MCPPLTGSGDSVVYKSDLLVRRCPVLKHFVDHHSNLQIDIIYGLQVTLSKKQHPKGGYMYAYTTHVYTHAYTRAPVTYTHMSTHARTHTHLHIELEHTHTHAHTLYLRLLTYSIPSFQVFLINCSLYFTNKM